MATVGQPEVHRETTRLHIIIVISFCLSLGLPLPAYMPLSLTLFLSVCLSLSVSLCLSLSICVYTGIHWRKWEGGVDHICYDTVSLNSTATNQQIYNRLFT